MNSLGSWVFSYPKSRSRRSVGSWAVPVPCVNRGIVRLECCVLLRYSKLDVIRRSHQHAILEYIRTSEWWTICIGSSKSRRGLFRPHVWCHTKLWLGTTMWSFLIHWYPEEIIHFLFGFSMKCSQTLHPYPWRIHGAAIYGVRWIPSTKPQSFFAFFYQHQPDPSWAWDINWGYPMISWNLPMFKASSISHEITMGPCISCLLISFLQWMWGPQTWCERWFR